MKLSDGKEFYLSPMLPRQYSARERARIRAKERMILFGESEQKSKHVSSDKQEESEGVNTYIENISKETDVDFNNFIPE